jgi:hypothetical protein
MKIFFNKFSSEFWFSGQQTSSALVENNKLPAFHIFMLGFANSI